HHPIASSHHSPKEPRAGYHCFGIDRLNCSIPGQGIQAASGRASACPTPSPRSPAGRGSWGAMAGRRPPEPDLAPDLSLCGWGLDAGERLRSAMPVLAGTSGWQYRDWRGVLYPPGLAQRRWLEYYADQYATVENNGAFYRLPGPQTFADWRARTPPDFVMA